MADDFIPGGLRHGDCRDRGAIPQDGDAVGDGENLLQLVRNIDAGDSPLAQIAKDGEENLDFMLRERGGRFIKNENARVFREGLDDFHELLLADAEALHRESGIDVDLKPIQKRAGVVVNARPIDEAEAMRFRA